MRRIWQEQFTPLVFDLDVRGELTPGAMCRYFGAAAGHHATELGVGDDRLRSQGLAWMLHRLEVQFAYAAAGEAAIMVETWPSERSGRLRAERDFTISDSQGQAIALGVSTWLLIHLATRRPARMLAEVLEVAVKGKPSPFKPSAEPAGNGIPDESRWKVPVAWTDLDINGHATFARLVEWTLGAAPPERWSEKRLTGMALRFEQEALPGELISARFEVTDGVGQHALTKSDGTVAVRGRTTWQPL